MVGVMGEGACGVFKTYSCCTIYLFWAPDTKKTALVSFGHNVYTPPTKRWSMLQSSLVVVATYVITFLSIT